MNRLLYLLIGFSSAALAQYAGPAVETCRVYAEKEFKNPVTFEKDRDLNIERYTRKVGSQFVSSVLSGHGAILRDGAPALPFSFVCLLANETRAVFFHWLPRADAPALTQCRGTGAGACLDGLLEAAERDLIQPYANQYAGDRRDAFRGSAEAWKAYRDAECARREGEEARKACRADLTRRRALDLE